MSLLLFLAACGDKDPGTTDPVECDTWYVDADGDGFGGDIAVVTCEPSAELVDNQDDCDDLSAAAYTGADEICDGVDNDCDGSIDNSPTDGTAYYVDADGDGYGDPASTDTACELTDGLTEDATDCDDGDAASNPGAYEVCDGADNDCDGLVDGHAVPADFGTIGEAIAAADDGDLICLDAGTYQEVLDFDGKSLAIEGAGSGSTTLDANGSTYPGVTIERADGSRVSGVTVTGSASTYGAGFYIRSTDGLELEDVVISDIDCAGTNCNGLAMHVWLSTLDLVDVDVVDNTATVSEYTNVQSYGIVRLESSDVYWEGGQVSGNAVSAISSGGTSNNYAYSYGIVYAPSTDLHLVGVEISDNEQIVEAESEGNYAYGYVWGALYSYNGDVTLEDVDIQDNTNWARGDADLYGQGIVYNLFYIQNSRFTWTGGTASDNVAHGESGYYGQGYNGYLSSGSQTLTDVDLHSNTVSATGDAGSQCYGLYSYQVSLDWRRVDLRDQLADCPDYNGQAGAGLYAYYSSVDLENVVVAGTRAEAGGVASAPVFLQYSEGELLNSTIHGNEATAPSVYSGAVHVTYGNGAGSAELTNTTITGNQVTADAYDSSYAATSAINAMYGAEVEMNYSVVSDNESNQGITFSNYGDTSWNPGTDGTGNLADSAGYSSTTGSDPTAWDLTLGAGSPLVDAGSPDILDADGSASDIGAYGGPNSW